MSPPERSSKLKGPNSKQVVPKSERAPREVANGYAQFDALYEMASDGMSAARFDLRPWMLMKLNHLAVDGVVGTPGRYRLGEIEIEHSDHVPPTAPEVARHVDDMCDYVNTNWSKPAVHLAAYLMWRLNWIHPFEDGNGRTSRAVSYLVLLVRIGGFLPGDRTVPTQLVEDKNPYYEALEHADKADAAGELDVSEMEELLARLLARQIEEAATRSWGNRDSIPTTQSSQQQGPRATTVTPESKATIKAAYIGGAAVIIAAVLGILAATTGDCSDDANNSPSLERTDDSAEEPALGESAGQRPSPQPVDAAPNVTDEQTDSAASPDP